MINRSTVYLDDPNYKNIDVDKNKKKYILLLLKACKYCFKSKQIILRNSSKIDKTTKILTFHHYD